MIAVEELPAVSRTPDGGRARRTGVVSRGTRVYLRTLRPEDLDYLSEWAEDPFLERMVGSEFLNTYKHVYDKDPSFYEACLMDSTQIVLVIEAEPEWAMPLGIARLFNIHLLEGYAFLEVMLTDVKAIRRGFGVEAGKLISYYGIDVLGLRRI
jgi:RimJ/RimL family protein N-acetyltransferase